MISIVSASGETAFTLSQGLARLMMKNHPNSIISMMIEDGLTTIPIPSPWTPCDIRMVVKEMLGYEVDVFRIFEGRTDLHTFLGQDVSTENFLFPANHYERKSHMWSFYKLLHKECSDILYPCANGYIEIFDDRDKFKKLHHFKRDIDRVCDVHIKALKSLIVRRKYTNRSFETQLSEREQYEITYRHIQTLCSMHQQSAQWRFKKVSV